MKILTALLLAPIGAIWLAALTLWTRPLLAPSYRAGEDFTATLLITLGLPAGAIFGFSLAFWFLKMPNWGRWLLALSSALCGFACYAHNITSTRQMRRA